MSKYPVELDVALDVAAANRAAASEAHDAMTHAETEAELLFNHIAGVREAILDSADRNEQDIAVIQSAQDHAREALGILAGLSFREDNPARITAEKQFAEGIRLLGRVSVGYGRMQNQLMAGKEDIDYLFGQVQQFIAPALLSARSGLMDAVYKQGHVADAIRAYIQRREDEYDDLIKARNQANGANQFLVPIAPEGAENPDIAADARPTALSIASHLEAITTSLSPAGAALQEYAADIAHILHIYEGAGRALIDWQDAPEDLKSRHGGLGEALHALGLPVDPALISGAVERLNAAKDDFTDMQTSQVETTGLINKARVWLSSAAKSVQRYLMRR